MIDNIHLITDLLNFSNEGDFYMLYVLKRKKDQPVGERDNHQSVRTIRSYCIKSIEHLLQRYDEIKMLCEVFEARAYIHVQKQNHKDVALSMMCELAKRIQAGHMEQQNLFDSIVGQMQTYEKRWIVDVDTKDTVEIDAIEHCINKICRPDNTTKIERVIPTANGVHLITERFDVMEFKKHFPNVDIQKKNPTLLYLPESLTTK